MNACTCSRRGSGGRRDSGPQDTAFGAHEDLPTSADACRNDRGDGAPALVGLTPPITDQRFPLRAVAMIDDTILVL